MVTFVRDNLINMNVDAVAIMGTCCGQAEKGMQQRFYEMYPYYKDYYQMTCNQKLVQHKKCLAFWAKDIYGIDIITMPIKRKRCTMFYWKNVVKTLENLRETMVFNRYQSISVQAVAYNTTHWNKIRKTYLDLDIDRMNIKVVFPKSANKKFLR